MRIKLFFILFVLLFASIRLLSQYQSDIEFAQDKLDSRGEFYFYFETSNLSDLIQLKEIISIDDVYGNIVYAYANQIEFDQFLEFNLPFNAVDEYYNAPKALTMATTVTQMVNWDRYPTHAVYVQMMHNFVTDYPDLCELEVIGQSENGYDLLCLRISDNVDTDEDEPEFFWTNTMHGDELASYVFSLRFANYLLSNYGSNTQVTNLVNEIEIYINPLANPDGTFNGSSGYTSVSNSTRYNSNGIDLNRNFPRIDGVGTSVEAEIQAMINFADLHDFNMSVNTHGGAELVNYPWDEWTSSVNPHPDDSWWFYIGWIYAGLAQANSPAGYFNDESGVTEGADWYSTKGSRQDYMNYFQHCREMTLEYTSTKKLDTEDLPAYWNYNRQAMLDYTEQILYGFRGIVTDACTGNALSDVKVEISGHDQDNSEVYSSAPVGNYHRPIYAGTYNVTFSLDGYVSQTHTVSVVNDESVRLDIALIPDNVGTPDFSGTPLQIYVGENVDFTDASIGTISSRSWIFEGGIPGTSSDINPSNISYSSSGIYDVSLEIQSNGCTITETKENYIEVFEPIAVVTDFTADITTVGVGNTVSFTDLSQNIPTDWSWTFEGGTPATSDEQNPVVTYNTPGIYNVSLTASNAFGGTTETKEEYISVIVDFCDAGGTDTDYMYVSNFTLNTINNSSGAAQYTDNTDISTELILGDTYSFSVGAGASYSYNQCLIWVDWNGDGDFIDTGEDVYVSSIGSATTYNGSITIPETAILGLVRIRIRMHYNRTGYGPNTTPCGFSNYGEVEDYSLLLVTPEVSPTADFSSDVTSTCTGTIQFTDESLLAESWSWDFGDGNSSTEENPLHTYTADGTYTVSLTVINAYGDDSHSETDYILVDMPDAPTTTGDERCGSGELTLSATGNGTLVWYDALTGGNIVNTGISYTDNFTSTTNLYVQSGVSPQYFSGGPSDISTNGGNHTSNAYYPIFTANESFRLLTVQVNASTNGNRIFELRNSNEDVLESVTVALTAGINTVNLNFDIPQGTDYQLRCATTTPNLWRNNSGVNYPYNIDDIVTITGSNAGSDYYYYFYNWEIMTGDECVSPRTPVTATIHDIPSVDLGDDVEQCGGTLVLSAETPGCSYHWNTNEATDEISISNSGTYSVTVTQGACTATDEVEVTIHDIPTVDLGDDQEQCGGSVTLDAGEGFESYEWNGTAGNPTHAVSTSGTYTVVVTDANTCTATDQVEVTIHELPTVDLGDDLEQCGGSVTLNAGEGFESYEWNGTAGTPIHAVSTSGTYTVVVSDANTCTATDQVEVTIHELPTVDLGDDLEQCGGSVTLNAGEGFESYEWNGTAGTPTHSVTASGTYTVVVSDANTCTATDQLEVTIHDIPTVDLGDDQEQCGGSVTLNAGEGFESYEWNGTAGTHIHTVSTSGTYTVVVSDANTCTATDQLEVTIHDIPTVDLGDDQEQCGGSVTLDAGEGFESYEWNGTAGTPTYSVTASGTYTVVVSDANTCTATDEVEVTIHELPTVALGDDQEQCGGSVTLDAGEGFESYEWNGTAGTPTHAVSTSGTYTVVVSDANTCTATDEVEVTIHDIPTVDLGDDFSICAGSTETLEAGSGFVLYQWNGVNGNENYTVSEAGTYTVVVTDNNSCTATDVVMVSELPSPTVILSMTEESTDGASDGTATATASDGTAPYSYTWNNGTGNPNTDLSAGMYCVTVQDSNVCTVSDCITVTVADQPNPPVAEFDADVNSGCDALTVHFTDQSTNNPTSWSWDFGDGSTSSEENPEYTYTTSGTYTVSLTVSNSDGTSDPEIKTEYIFVGITPEFELYMTQESSEDAADGTATVSVSLANFPVTYSWSNSEYTNTITGLTAGNYCITVSGNDGCMATDCIEVTLNSTTTLSADFETNTTEGCAPLEIDFTDLSSGNPVSWTWNFGDGGSSSMQNPIYTFETPGTYTVMLTIVDAENNNDTEVKTEYITVYPKPVLAFEVTDESAEDAFDGEIELTISNGTSPYTINWSNNMHTPIISGLTAGVYSVAVIDANACMATGSATVNVYTFLDNISLPQLSLYPNPFENMLYLESDVIITGIKLIDASGRIIRNQELHAYSTAIELMGLAKGNYILVVSRSNQLDVIKHVIKN
jgi:PKD repeat protein